jgi:hypothetical protein
MPPSSSAPNAADAPLRPGLVLGWSVFFVAVVAGLVAALWYGPSVPVLLDVLTP